MPEEAKHILSSYDTALGIFHDSIRAFAESDCALARTLSKLPFSEKLISLWLRSQSPVCRNSTQSSYEGFATEGVNETLIPPSYRRCCRGL